MSERAEEERLRKQREDAAFTYLRLKSDAMQFEEEIRAKYRDEFDEDPTDQEIEEYLGRKRQKKDLAKFRIVRIFKDMDVALREYTVLIDRYEYAERVSRSGPESSYYDEKEKKRVVATQEALEHQRVAAHKRLIGKLGELLVAYQNAGLDTSWKKLVSFDRYDVTVWAKDVRDGLAEMKQDSGGDAE